MLGKNTSKLSAKPTAAAAALGHEQRTGSLSLSELCHCRMLSAGATRVWFCRKWYRLEGSWCFSCLLACMSRSSKRYFEISVLKLKATRQRRDKLQRGARKTLDSPATILTKQAVFRAQGPTKTQQASQTKGTFCSAPYMPYTNPCPQKLTQEKNEATWQCECLCWPSLVILFMKAIYNSTPRWQQIKKHHIREKQRTLSRIRQMRVITAVTRGDRV